MGNHKTYEVTGRMLVEFRIEVEAESKVEAIDMVKNNELFQAMNGYYRCDADLWEGGMTDVEAKEM